MVLGHDIMHPYLDPRVYKEAKSLVKHGHNVTVVCWPRRIENLPEWEDYEGIKIRRVTHKLAPKEVSILIRGMQFQKLKRKMVNTIVHLKPEVIHCHDLETLPIGIKVKKKLRIPLIYDSHEDWPALESAQSRMWGFVTKILERWYLRNVDVVVTISENLANKKFRRYGQRTIVVFNTRPLNELIQKYNKNKKQELRNMLGLDANDFVVGYIGALSKHRGLDVLIHSLKYIPSKHVKVLIVGGLKDEISPLENFAKGCGVEDRVYLTGKVPYKEVMPYFGILDVGVILFQPLPNHFIAVPNKLFEYMGAGVPLIVSNFPEMGRIVKEGRCGITVDPTQPKEIAKAIMSLKENPNRMKEYGLNGRKAVEREYNWEKQEEKLIKLYKGII